MNYVILFIVCILINIVINLIFFSRKPSGTLRIDHSNPEKDIYRFEIDDFDALSRKTKITIKVDNNAHISQE